MLGLDILVVKSDQSNELIGVYREVWISHLGGIHSRRPHAVADSAPKFVPVNDGRSPFLDRPLAVRGHAFLAGIERVHQGKRIEVVGSAGARNALDLDPKDDARTVHEVPPVGLEPTTKRLKVSCATIAPRRQKQGIRRPHDVRFMIFGFLAMKEGNVPSSGCQALVPRMLSTIFSVAGSIDTGSSGT